MSDERRRFTRIPFKVDVEMTVNEVSYRAEEISDLSIGGCLLPVVADLEPGTVCQVKLVLSGTNTELSIRIKGEIQRSLPGGLAIKFTRIDPDSLFHLQNVVRYNSPDADEIDREILDHPGLV